LAIFCASPQTPANHRQHTIKVANFPVNMPPKPGLTSDQRKQVVSQLVLFIKDDDLPPKLIHGLLTMVANNFNMNPKRLEKYEKGRS
jgi:hypothetical protein